MKLENEFSRMAATSVSEWSDSRIHSLTLVATKRR